jgi:hypothetical protein
MKPPEAREPHILVTGVARSGTSWLGRTLGYGSDVDYVFEPDNVDADPRSDRVAGARGFGPYPVIAVGEHHAGFEALWDMVFQGTLPRRRGLRLAAGRVLLGLPAAVRDPLMRQVAHALGVLPHSRRRRVVKSIYSPFALEWLTDRYRPLVVVLQRHPLNVVSSWREMGIPVFDLATRPAILNRHARPRGLEPPAPGTSELVRMAWCVGLLSTVLGEAIDRHPDWILATHEDLCADPGGTMRELAGNLGLQWNSAIDRFLAESDRPGKGLAPVRVTREQPQRWRARLTATEVEEVNSVLGDFPRRGWVREPRSMLRRAAASGGGS